MRVGCVVGWLGLALVCAVVSGTVREAGVVGPCYRANAGDYFSTVALASWVMQSLACRFAGGRMFPCSAHESQGRVGALQ